VIAAEEHGGDALANEFRALAGLSGPSDTIVKGR
jgi:hypothetical protein